MNSLVGSLRQRWIPLLNTPLVGVANVGMRMGLARFTTNNGVSYAAAAATTTTTTVTDTNPIIVPEKQFPLPKGPVTNRNLIEVVTAEQLERLDPTGEKRALISRRSRTHVNAGDVVMVESYTSRTKGTTTRFMGVCIGIYRKGVDSGLHVRNIIERIGVEFRFPVFSPMIKRIEILKRGEGYRRAKLFYLREQPGKAFQLAGLRKQQQQQQKAALAAKAKKA